MNLWEIDAANPISYKQPPEQLEHHLIWLILAAGKNGRKAAETAWKLVQDLKKSPLEVFTRMGQEELGELIRKNGGGCYNQKASYIIDLGRKLDLSTISRGELVKLRGIKYKTASCFLLHTRPNVRMVGLDRHVVRHLHELDPSFPEKPPTSKQAYLECEQRALKIADKLGVKPARFDLDIWRLRSVEYK